MGKLKMGLPQRVSKLSFDTPRDVTGHRDGSSGQPLVSIPFSLIEENEEKTPHSSSPDSYLKPVRYRQRSVSPVLPSLRTVNVETLLEQTNSSVHNRSSRISSSADPHQNVKPNFMTSHRGNSSSNSLHNFEHLSHLSSEYLSRDESRSRHRSQSPSQHQINRTRSQSSPSLFKLRSDHRTNPLHTLSPLKEFATPNVSRISPVKSFQHKNVFHVKGQSYTVVDKIGSGGSSEVFRVLDEHNAIKAIKKVDLSEVSEHDAMSFRKEVELLMRLKDKRRIVQIFDFVEMRSDGGRQTLVVVMEHGEKDLARLLKEYSAGNNSDKNELTDAKTKFYWEEMLEAVQVIHDEGIVHSDLKPANFLIVGGTIKLIDFGIASSVENDRTHVTKENPLGTLNFMSPESIQYNEEGYKSSVKISVKSDVWSLGCILYNMIYGKLPFSHIRNPYHKIRAIVDPNHVIEFPRKNIENHDPLVVNVLQRCLVRDPGQRASIGELLRHPYIRKTPAPVESDGKMDYHDIKPQSKVEDILSAFSSLTPNSKKMLVEQLGVKSNKQ